MSSLSSLLPSIASTTSSFKMKNFFLRSSVSPSFTP